MDAVSEARADHLPEVLGKLSLDRNVKRLCFTIEGPDLKAVEELLRGDETRFQSIIRHLKNVIEGQITTQKQPDCDFVYEMELEAIREQRTNKHQEIDTLELAI
jgi:hypothetical protein